MWTEKTSADTAYTATSSSVIFAPETYAKPRFYDIVKRIFGIVLSAVALICLAPLFLILAICIKCDSKGPAIFVQTRVGKNGKNFSMYKFRTMCVDAEKQLAEIAALNERDGPAFKVTDDPRVTRVGKFIRATCLDELPQLINILKGDMCIVGPRPPLPNEVELYTPYQRQRLHIKPGLTCYWQVTKHDRTTFDEWVEMDLKYIRERSFWTDIKLIFKSFYVVLHRKGDY